MAPTVTLAHLSDTHLGYEAYTRVSANGNNQRGEDFVNAYLTMCRDIAAMDPPLVIHSGDVGEKPAIPTKYMLAAKRGFEILTGLRPDGSRRQCVVIAGNHDAPASRKDDVWFELLRDMPGMHVTTYGYDTIAFDPEEDLEVPPELAGVIVHTLPHESLKELDFYDVKPVEGFTNILVTHGVAEGSKLYFRARGREYPVPHELMTAGWDYVALGHWHKQGPVQLNKGPEDTNSVAWYAGSSESSGFRDVRLPEVAARRWLEVKVRPSRLPLVNSREVQTRKMIRLDVVDAANLTAAELQARLLANLAKTDIESAVVMQKVVNTSSAVWASVDTAVVRAAATSALHYEFNVSRAQVSPGERSEVGSSTSDFEGLLLHLRTAVEKAPEKLRPQVLDAASNALKKALEAAAAS